MSLCGLPQWSATVSNLIDKLHRAVSDYGMLRDGDSVLVALSCGADSVALLNSLLELKTEYNLNIFACHLNHQLRGEEADSDESFVRSLCEQKGVELFVKGVDVKALSAERKIGGELCGREVRYEFFAELSDRLNAKVATAHTASDNAETVLFNLARGAGLNGLCGISPVRGNIIRPLIYVTREEVEQYCRENNLSFVTDSTNLTDDYTRNKLRHRVIPVLRELNPDFENSVSRGCSNLREVNSYLELKTDEAISFVTIKNGYSRKGLLELHEAVRRNALYSLIRENGAQPESKLVTLLNEIVKNGGAVNLSNGIRAVAKQDTLRFVKAKEVEDFSELELKPDTEVMYNSKRYSVKELKIDKAVLRTRRAGDYIYLPKRGVSKTLKKLFNELKIPEEKRGQILVAAKDSEVFWIEGAELGNTKVKIDVEILQ